VLNEREIEGGEREAIWRWLCWRRASAWG